MARPENDPAPLARTVGPRRASPDLDGLIERYLRAERVYNTWKGEDGSSLEAAWREAFAALETYEPSTPSEYIRWISARFRDGTAPTDADCDTMIAIAHKLAVA